MEVVAAREGKRGASGRECRDAVLVGNVDIFFFNFQKRSKNRGKEKEAYWAGSA